MQAHLIPRSLSFLSPPLLEGCGRPHRLPWHCCLPHHPQHHRPWPTTTTASTGVLIGAQVHRQEVGVLTAGWVYQQEAGYWQQAGVSTTGGCINNRACILTARQMYWWWGRCIDDGVGVLTAGQVHWRRKGISMAGWAYQWCGRLINRGWGCHQEAGVLTAGLAYRWWAGVSSLSSMLNPRQPYWPNRMWGGISPTHHLAGSISSASL